MLQEFIQSIGGQIILAVLIGGLLMGIMIISKKDEKNNVRALSYSALALALAFVLNQITLLKMPQGGSVTPFSMLFIILIAFWFGPRQGIMVGIAFGLLDLLINPYVVHPVQLLLDYPLAFGALGLAGLFSKKNLISGYLVGILGRFICHVLSGIVFFGAWAPEGFNAVTWSLIYNVTYLGTEAALTCLLLLIPSIRNAIVRVRENLV